MHSRMSVELSYEELMCAYCPLWDAARSIATLKERSNGNKTAEDFLENLDGQIHRAMTILSLSIADLEADNPSAFGGPNEGISKDVSDLIRRL